MNNRSRLAVALAAFLVLHAVPALADDGGT